jgi:hypothetical protein
MNGYDALSEAQLSAHNRATPTPQPATDPQIRPRETLAPLSEAISSADLEKLLVLLHDLESQDDEDWDDHDGMMREAPLTAQRRNDLPNSAFALPGRRYPIDTPERARAALSRIMQFGSPDEQRRVRAAVRRRYPDMDVEGGNSD